MIRKLKHNKILILLAIFIVASILAGTNNASAAACSNSGNYGSATMPVNIPATGDYRIWSRIKVPNSANSTYQLEIDGNSCWQVGGNNVPANTWTWVDWYGGNSAQKININFTTSGTHTFKIIGFATNVEVDKVLLLGSGELCTDNASLPSGDGSNCASGPASVTTSPGSSGSSSPSSSAPIAVTGSTTPSIVTENKDNAAQTSYLINGKVVQSSKGATALDTTKLPNGTYEVQTIVTLKDGTKVTQTQKITVNNKNSFFAKYSKLIIMVSLAVFILVCILVFVGLRTGILKKPHMFNKPKSIKNLPFNQSPIYQETIIRPTNDTQVKPQDKFN